MLTFDDVSYPSSRRIFLISTWLTLLKGSYDYSFGHASKEEDSGS